MTKLLRTTPWLATAAALALAIPVAASADEKTDPAQECAALAPTPLLATPVPGLAHETTEPTLAPAIETAAPTAVSGAEFELPALKGGVDPKTGAVRPTTEAEDAALAAAIRDYWLQFPTYTVKNDRKNHRKSLRVAPGYLSVSVATVGADGKAAWDCADSTEDAVTKLQELRAAAAAQAANASKPEDR